MKRILCVVLLAAVLLLCGCSETSVSRNARVQLSFVFGEESIKVTLTPEEAYEVTGILDGKEYASDFGIPSCGFDKDISLTVDGHVYAIACDRCSTIQDCSTFRYFDISRAEMDYIHDLFEQYGGFFPCI